MKDIHEKYKKNWFRSSDMEELYRTYPDPWAYSTTAIERYSYVIKKVKDMLEKANADTKTILEVGCSEGVFTKLLTEAFPEVTIHGCDISKTALGKAIERTVGGNVRFHYADIGKMKLPFPDKSVQLLFMCDVLYMLPSRDDVEFAVREINRVLGPDGIVVITEFTKTRKFSDMVCGAIGNRLHDSRESIHFDIHPTTGKIDDTQSYRFLIFGRRDYGVKRVCRACRKEIVRPYKDNEDSLCENCYRTKVIVEAEAEAERRKGIPEDRNQGIRTLRI